MTQDLLDDLPDMDELARQMKDAMAEAQKAMQDLPMQMEGLEDVMGSLSALMSGLPAQMQELGSAMVGFGEQLKKGRGIAVVESIEILECRIQGAPGNAAATLQLSPEANIPLPMDENGIGFEFAPLLTIRNRWERANIPTFSPMGQEIVVPLAHLESGEAFTCEFAPAGQEDEMTVALSFQPLDR